MAKESVQRGHLYVSQLNSHRITLNSIKGLLDKSCDHCEVLTLAAGRTPLGAYRVGLRSPTFHMGIIGVSPLIPSSISNASEYHLNHCHMEKGGSKTQPRPRS